MASDQMLPNSSVSSKKQQQLEAGKKRLEEFRKKKAAAKKSASSNSVHSANGDLHETKPSVSDTVQVTDGTSDVGSGFSVGKNEKKTIDVHDDEPLSMYVTNASPISSYNIHSASSGQTYSADEKLRDQDAPSGKFGLNAGYGADIEQSRIFHHPEEDIHSNSNHFSNVQLEDALTNSRDDRLKDFTSTTPVKTQVSVTKSSPERSYGASFANNSYHNDQLADGQTYRDSSSEVGKSLDGLFKHGYPPVPGVGDRKYSSPVDHQASESSSSLWSSESRPTSFKFDAEPSSHNEASVSPALMARRPRPSFLDAITVSRNSSTSVSHVEMDKADLFSSKVHPVDAPVSSDSQSFMNSSVASAGNLFRQGGNELDVERKNSFHSTKQNEDFAALEQHIEDLTQEKFSLQRALEASRVLAESLATENMALTDTYNQQGSVVNQLKSDMENLQEEITAQLVELEAVKTEYGNARLECSAADERAKLLASEVIALEEKALRLRSNELKLERQLENLEDAMSSQKKRISSLEKEHKDFQSTIDALQEEKKLMQSMLRKAPASEKSGDIKKSPTTKKEASTSTDDLVNENKDSHATSNLAMPAALGESDASGTNFGLEVSSLNIPQDQMRMIQNINTLISELALEKEELTQALSAESSQTSKLKDLNKELSQKLEIQTQRLELLTSQSMVSDNNSNNNNNNISARKSGSHTMVDNTPFADEGDEVVERVLGWIMKLFPGGPSKRQTKHL